MLSKKTLICLLVLSALQGNKAYAFPNFPGGRLAVELGLNYSTFDYHQELFYIWEDVNWRTVYSGGLYCELPITPKLSVAPGLRFLQYGDRVEVDYMESDQTVVTSWSGHFDMTQNYLALPVRIRIYPTVGRNIYLIGGPEFGYLLSAHAKNKLIINETFISDTSIVTYDNAKQEITDDLNRFHLSIGAGIGYRIPIGIHAGLTEIRYSRGLLGSAKPDRWFSDWKVQGFEFLVGFIW